VGGGVSAAKVEEGLGGGVHAIDPIQGEDVKVDVQVHRATEALNEGDSAGAGRVFLKVGGADQVAGSGRSTSSMRRGLALFRWL
jgi:hypothetical protein